MFAGIGSGGIEVVGTDVITVFACCPVVGNVVVVGDGGSLCRLDVDERYGVVGLAMNVLLVVLAEMGDAQRFPVDIESSFTLFMLIASNVDAVDTFRSEPQSFALVFAVFPGSYLHIRKGLDAETKAMWQPILVGHSTVVAGTVDSADMGQGMWAVESDGVKLSLLEGADNAVVLTVVVGDYAESLVTRTVPVQIVGELGTYAFVIA